MRAFYCLIFLGFISNVAWAGQVNFLQCSSKNPNKGIVAVELSDNDPITAMFSDRSYVATEFAAPTFGRTTVSYTDSNGTIAVFGVPQSVHSIMSGCKTAGIEFEARFSGDVLSPAVKNVPVHCSFSHLVSAGSSCD